MKQIGQSPEASLRLEGASEEADVSDDAGAGAAAKISCNSLEVRTSSVARSMGRTQIRLTEDRKASWYCRCSGALRTLCRTFAKRLAVCSDSYVAGEIYIYDVLTLIALLTIRACATRELADSNAVDVACSACKFNRLFRNLWGATVSPINNKHPAGHDKS